MDVSIIIVNYRTPQLIIQCINSIKLHSNGFQYEFIVVDNDISHGGKDEVLLVHPEIRWLDMGYNAGFGRANNLGMKQAKGRYFLLLNADTVIADNVIDRCLQRLDNDPGIVAGGAKQLYADKSPIPFYKSFNEFRKTFFILPPTPFFTRLLDRIFPEPSYPDPEQHDWLVGAFMLVRRSAFEATNGFEEALFMYGEDVEWSGRLGILGRLCYLDNCSFIHLENENPFRRTHISWINRFSVQMQVSNLVWIRKKYGIAAYTTILAHYISMLPVIYIWRMAVNVKEHQNPFYKFDAQHIFFRKVIVLLRYFPKTINYQHHFFQILPEENIDKLLAE